MMRIGLFCQEYPPRPHGGIGTFVQTLAEGLAVQGHRVTLVELGDHPGERRQAGVEIVTLPLSRVPKIGWLLNRLRLRGWVRDAVRQGRMDIFELPEFEGWMPFGGLPCPVVVRLHLAMSILRAEAGLSTHRVSRGCEYLTLRQSDCWIGVSGYVLDLGQRFFGLTPTAARVIHNPVGPVDTAGTASPKTTAAEQDKGAYCLFVGNLRESKGVLTLARATSLARQGR